MLLLALLAPAAAPGAEDIMSHPTAREGASPGHVLAEAAGSAPAASVPPRGNEHEEAEAPLDEQARAIVERLQQALIAAMKKGDEGVPFQERLEYLTPIIVETHALGNAASATLGGHWRGIDADQRATFTERFTRLSTTTYTTHFDSHSGESFRINSIRVHEGARPRVVVRTTLVRPRGDDVSLDYLLQLADGRLRIVNILAEGVSDIAVKRAEYTAILDSEGFDRLIERIDKKIAENVSTPTD